MRSALLALALVAVSCSLTASDEPTPSSLQTLPTLPPTVPTTIATTTSTLPPLELCQEPGSFPTVLPDRVVDGLPDSSQVAFDEFTLIEGAFSAMRFDEVGTLVVVMIRGALPPRQFTGEHQVVHVLEEIPAQVGPIGDGYWAAAWALPPGDRCDLYSLIFYPPVTHEEAVAVTESVR